VNPARRRLLRALPGLSGLSGRAVAVGAVGAVPALAGLLPADAQAGAQQYEPMQATVRASLSRAISDQVVSFHAFDTDGEAKLWLADMGRRLQRRMPDQQLRDEFLMTLHYESTRAGLDVQMVLGLIQVESAFRKYAVSVAGARGYMQVMPFWIDVIGQKDHNLFHLRTNLRYGCVILRHYVDIERGNLFRALGRYNGSLGKPDYPNLVVRAWINHWKFDPLAATRLASGGPAVQAAGEPTAATRSR
jgi:soluble lytic murein transglycosylase-like protein